MSQPYRFCPHCQTSLEGADEERRCPQCNARFYTNVAATAGIILLNEQHEALLARRARRPHQGAYGITGGFIAPGETAQAAALRETQEEAGVTDIEILDLLGTFPDRYGDDGAYTLNIIYVGRLLSGQPVPADDVAALEWHHITKLPPAALTEGFRNSQAAFRALQAWWQSRREASHG